MPFRRRAAKPSPSLRHELLEPRRALASFAGTAGDDVVIVTFVNSVPVTVEINGVPQSNPDPTITLDLISGRDDLRLQGDDFNVVIDRAASNRMQISVPGALTALLGTSPPAGSTEWRGLTTGDGNDQIQVNGTFFFELDVSTGGGNDLVLVNDLGNSVFDLGAGDDRLENLAGGLSGIRWTGSAAGGAGLDTLVNAAVQINFVDSNGQIVMSSFNNVYSTTYEGFETFVSDDPQVPGTSLKAWVSRVDYFPSGYQWVIDGNLATLNSANLSAPVRFEGFRSFSGLIDTSGVYIYTGRVSVLSTTSDLSLVGFDRVEIGFRDFTAPLGSTAGILHDIRVDIAETVVVSDAQRTGGGWKNIRLSRQPIGGIGYDVIEGIAGGNIVLSRGFDRGVRKTVLWGSDSQPDLFDIESTGPGETTIYGGQSQDAFHVGGLNTRNLDGVAGIRLSLVGSATDLVYINDDLAVGSFAYTVTSDWIGHRPNPRSALTRDFRGVSFSGLKTVVVTGSSAASHFFVAPSTTREFILNGNSGSDTLTLSGTVPSYQLINGTDYWFGADGGLPRVIRTSNIEALDGTSRFAAGSAAGSAPLVNVHDARMRGKLFSFNPFPQATGFTGGLSVATGSLLTRTGPSDWIPDIVVAAASNGGGHVAVFDGRNGSWINGFVAFPGYTGGLDVAVANVLGDETNEIIVSQLDGGNRVRVFVPELQSGPGGAILNGYRLRHEYNAFPNAPAIGSRLAAGDVNGDGFAEIYSAAGPGWLPQVAIYSVDGTGPVQRSRFLAHGIGYTGGLTIAAGNFLGDFRSDVMVGIRGSGTVSSVLRGFNAADLPQNQGGTVLAPSFARQPFSGTTDVLSVALFDANSDGVCDRFVIARRAASAARAIQVRDGAFALIDTVIADKQPFGTGIELG